MLPAIIYTIVWFLVPFLLLTSFSIFTKKGIGAAMEITTTPTLENYYRTFQGDLLHSLMWTIEVSVLIAIISIVLALPVAYYLARSKGPKAFIDLSLLFPFFGGIFYAYALLYAFAPQGIINWALLNLHLIQEPLRLLKTNESVIIVSSIIDISIATMLLRSGLVEVDPVYEEAAMCMGASRLKAFFKVDVPLVKTALAGAWLLIFGGEVASYNLPYIVAGPHNKWMSSKLYLQLVQYTNFPLSAAIAVVLTLLSVIVLLMYMKTIGRGR
jgi:spermidine/putrescine transport system permease protein